MRMLVKQVRKGRVTIEEAAEDAGMTVEEFKKILENTPLQALYVGGFWKLCFDPQKEQQIKIEGEFKPTVDCLCATRRGFVAVYIEKVRSAECT